VSGRRAGIAERIVSDWDGGADGEVMCRYLTPGGRTFLGLRQVEGGLGYPQAVAVHEGRIAEALSAAVERCGAIEVRRGEAVVTLAQDERGVEVGLRCHDDGRSRHERAGWAVACDGCGQRGAQACRRRDARRDARGATWLVANVAESAPVLHATIRCDPVGRA
jgi:2-polyprenyl-6-methoxyphenol hydroxylase-like FAD-dependent oxidoreductase